jgi:5-methylcytosine-specific restriction endonuclease McrA
MDEVRLRESIEIFKQYYLQSREYYEEEREWKIDLSNQFQGVFTRGSITGVSFLDSLKALFENSRAAQSIILLSGGSFYQYQRFLDLLMSGPDQALLSELFQDLIFSQARVRNRINNFKSAIDSLYRGLPRKSTIQLNLISQFLGLCFPNEHYVYKSTEFKKAAAYFEFGGRPSDGSAGATYEYYHRLAKEIKSAMNEAKLETVDFIDVQTFVFRKDWHSPANLEQEKGEYEKETAKAELLSVGALVDRIRKSKPVPAKIVHGVYHYRNPNIAALVKKDAQGICDLCGKKAPFENRAGKPYLECHHIKHLAGGGKDDIVNCVALCPNCHAKMHILNLEPDQQRLLDAAKERHRRFFAT